jgi:hypothetical protein
MLLKRQYWFCLGAMIPVGLAAAISIGMGWDLVAEFSQLCLAAGSYAANAGYQPTAAHNIRGAVQLVFGEGTIGGNLAALSLALTSLALALGSIRGGWEGSERRWTMQFSAMIVATILLSAHFYTYDLSILILPMVLVGAQIAADTRAMDSERLTCRFARWPAHITVIAMLFVGSGLFATAAEHTGFPLSVPILFCWLVLLTRESTTTCAAESFANSQKCRIPIRAIIWQSGA